MSLIDAIPLTMQRIGQAEAKGKAASGNYGMLLSDVGKMISSIPEDNARRRSQAMQEQVNALRLTQAKREEAAGLAIQNATQSALGPDGSLDPNKLTAALAGTPAASKIPEILQHMNALQESALRLRSATISAGEAEDDSLGALFYAASQLTDPHDKAGMIAAGLASGIKQGTVRKESANQILGSILGDDGEPVPEKVDATTRSMIAKSGKQRGLAATETQKEAAAQSALSLKAEREERVNDRNDADALANYSAQLAGATSKERYARVYAGIPPKYRARFDAPEDWTTESPNRAIEAIMSPVDRIRLRTEGRQEKVDAERERHDRAMEATAAANAARLARGTSGDDKEEKAEKADYKEFVAQYNKSRDEEEARRPEHIITDKDDLRFGTSVKDQAQPYVAPPSYQKWQAMTDDERARVIVQPNTRIDDAEMGRRTGKRSMTETTHTEPATPAAAPKAAPAGKAKTVTAAQLQSVVRLMQSRGTTTSLDEQKKRYEAGGYTVLP